MKISVTIMAHPKRHVHAVKLAAELSKYPFIESTITLDQINDEWDTGERALRAGIKAAADWHVVLQDDAIICDDFYNNLVNALSAVPSRVLVSLYTGTAQPLPERVISAVKRAPGGSWLQGYTLFWGVAIAVPSWHIEPMLEFAAGRTELYDSRIGIFYNRNMLKVLYTNPSLVDHNDDLGTLLDNGKKTKRRVAVNFINGPVVWTQAVTDI